MNNEARQEILSSIRTHLTASLPSEPQVFANERGSDPPLSANIRGLFKENLESVAGHCLITTDVADVLRQIITDLRAQRIAISDAPQLAEFGVIPRAGDIFNFDVGITTAQAAIAETGTLVLDSSCERNRLVSVVPPVHIAIVPASRICATLADVLAMLQSAPELSPVITFITGPSRTADIELTLTIGVHGPKELYVIVDEST
jgi:L-lactate dehydrogenase complex protein LldG